MGNFLFIKIKIYFKISFILHSRPERLDTHHGDHNDECEAKADIKDPVVLAGKCPTRQITVLIVSVSYNILHLVAAVNVKCLGVVVLHIVSAGIVFRGGDAMIAFIELGLSLDTIK